MIFRHSMWILVFLASAVTGQHLAYHHPVNHHGSAKSFQSFTYFGRGHSPAPAAPAQTPAPFRAPAPTPAPFRAAPAPAPYSPAPAPTPFRAAPAPAPYSPAPAPTPFRAAPAPAPFSSAPAPVQFRAASAPAPVHVAAKPFRFIPQTAVRKAQPVTPAGYTPTFPTAAPVAAPQPSSVIAAKNVLHKPSFYVKKSYSNPSVSKTKPSNNQNTFFRQAVVTTTPFTTTTFKAAPLRIDVPASTIVDDAIKQIEAEGPKIVNIIRKLQTNRLVKRLLAPNPSDPCTILPEDIAGVFEKMISATVGARTELIEVIASAQEMKKNEDNTEIVLKEASNAVLAVNPLVPQFEAIFSSNDECQSSIEATIKGFQQVGNVLEVLGSTNLASSDAETKSKILKGGEATKILSNVARALENDGFTSLCVDSPTFNGDVFMGVSKLLEGFKDIAATFEANSELSQLEKTVEIIRDGAELLNDLNLDDQSNQVAVPRSGGDCVTSLPDVAKSLAEVADLVSVIDNDFSL